MKNLGDYVFWLIPLAGLAVFAGRYIRRGSLAGALLGGRITGTVGEIDMGSSAFSSRVLKVQTLSTSPDATPQVALAIVSKAPMGASVVPLKLSREQAQQLISLLERAISTK